MGNGKKSKCFLLYFFIFSTYRPYRFLIWRILIMGNGKSKHFLCDHLSDFFFFDLLKVIRKLDLTLIEY